MTVAYLIVRRNQKLEDVPLEHTIIGTTEVIGIALTEAERDRALQDNPKAHALEMNRLGVIDGGREATKRLNPTATLAVKEFYTPTVTPVEAS